MGDSSLESQVELTEKMLFQRALQLSLTRVPARSMGAGATKKSKDMWKMLSYTAVPLAVLGTALFVYKREQAHLAHYTRPEHKEYPWMWIRNKKYPWGDGYHSFFHNSHVNGVYGKGYEEDH